MPLVEPDSCWAGQAKSKILPQCLHFSGEKSDKCHIMTKHFDTKKDKFTITKSTKLNIMFKKFKLAKNKTTQLAFQDEHYT